MISYLQIKTVLLLSMVFAITGVSAQGWVKKYSTNRGAGVTYLL